MLSGQVTLESSIGGVVASGSLFHRLLEQSQHMLGFRAEEKKACVFVLGLWVMVEEYERVGPLASKETSRLRRTSWPALGWTMHLDAESIGHLYADLARGT